MILYRRNPKESTRKLLEPIKKVKQDSRIQDQHKILIVFLYTSNELSENKIKKVI